MRELTRAERKKRERERQERIFRTAENNLRNRVIVLMERSVKKEYSPEVEAFMTDLQALVVKHWPDHFRRMMWRVQDRERQKEKKRLAEIRKKQLELGL